MKPHLLLLSATVALVLLILSCSPDEQAQIESLAQQLGQQAVTEAKAKLEAEAANVFANLNDERKKREQVEQVLKRASLWVDATPPVPYSIDATRDGYRTDCSGFVSYAWQLQKNGKPVSPDTAALGNTWTVNIPFADLQSGDLLNNNRAGKAGHVVIFIRWKDDKHIEFEAYEENGDPDGNDKTNDGKALKSNLTLVKRSDGKGYDIREFVGGANGPFYAQRIVNPQR